MVYLRCVLLLCEYFSMCAGVCEWMLVWLHAKLYISGIKHACFCLRLASRVVCLYLCFCFCIFLFVVVCDSWYGSPLFVYCFQNNISLNVEWDIKRLENSVGFVYFCQCVMMKMYLFNGFHLGKPTIIILLVPSLVALGSLNFEKQI